MGARKDDGHLLSRVWSRQRRQRAHEAGSLGWLRCSGVLAADTEQPYSEWNEGDRCEVGDPEQHRPERKTASASARRMLVCSMMEVVVAAHEHEDEHAEVHRPVRDIRKRRDDF